MNEWPNADVEIEPGTVVAGVDGTQTAVRAATWAATEARVRGVALCILHAAPYATDPPGARRAQSIRGVARTAARYRERAVDVHTVLSRSTPLAALAAAGRMADLLVIGMITGDSPAEAVLGSLTPTISDRARCPVVVVRGGPPARPGMPLPVVVGLHSTQDDGAALTAAFADATRHRSGLVVVHARAAHLTERDLADWTAEWRDAHPDVPVEYRLGRGNARDALLDAARGARLVVLGAHRRSTPARVLFGSTTRELLRLSPTPVEVVRPRDPSLPVPAASGERSTGGVA